MQGRERERERERQGGRDVNLLLPWPEYRDIHLCMYVCQLTEAGPRDCPLSFFFFLNFRNVFPGKVVTADKMLLPSLLPCVLVNLYNSQFFKSFSFPEGNLTIVFSRGMLEYCGEN